MNNSKQSLADFLGEQETNQSALLVTVEPVPGDEQLINITPFSNEGCGCHNSLAVPKETIEWVEKTGQSLDCCGSTHAVVRVGFKEGASILLDDVFQQLNKAEKHENISLEEFDDISISDPQMDLVPFSLPDEIAPVLSNCRPAYSIGFKKCLFKKNGSWVQGSKTLMIYKNRLGKVCKVEWEPCR